MRKRIEELAEGNIPYEQPQIKFSKDKLELEAVEGHAVTADFQIKSENGIVMRGIVYSSSTKMECLTSKFEGIEADIQVRFHADGMTEREVASGELCVVMNGGEYRLPYAVTITRLYAEASSGKIKNIKDFTKLAQNEWKEAYHIFHSPAFKNILARKDLKALLLYEGISSPSVTEHAMEEFLVGIGKKKRVHFSLAQHSTEYFGLKKPSEEQVQIKKEGWGYLHIRVSASDAFLVPQKNCLTDADFMGDSHLFSFYIDTKKMHAGNNFGCIYFESNVQRESLSVWASADSLETKKERTHQEIQKVKNDLTRCYVDYRLRKIVTGEWTMHSVAYMKRLKELKAESEWHLLFQAYALLRNKQRQDAEWLMNDYRRKYKDTKKPQWAFYDYLCLQNEKEPLVVERLLTEIEGIVRHYAYHPMMFFLTLRLNGVLRTQPQLRLKAIEDRIALGEYTPIWYVEAFLVYKELPYMLTKLEKYEILVMNWASRQGVLTRDLADQTMRLANNMRRFMPILCRVLFRCYEQYPDEDMLAGVCAYLIKGQRYQLKYHSWYAKGVEANLKITGLYEAFLLTMDLHNMAQLPKVIQMYFQYNNQLSYQYKAALYVNIIAHKDVSSTIYGKYTETIKQFAIDEILKGHIDDNLAVIYEETLDKGILTQELAAPLADILYTHKLYCMNPMASFAVVIQKHVKGEQRVPIVGNVAYFQLFSNDYAILLEDNRGQRYVSAESCQLEKLMKPSHYIRRCLKLAPDRLPYILHHMDGKADLSMPEKSDIAYLRVLMDAPSVSAKFKNQIGPGLVHYLMINEKEEDIENYLAMIDFSDLNRDSRNVLVELMIEHGWNEKAYELVNSYGYNGIKRQSLAMLAAYMIRARDVGEDAFLLELCLAALQGGVRNSALVSYLANYYEGPLKQMRLVYQAALECELVDTKELEERLLVQALYTTESVDRLQEAYQGYRMHNGRDFILQAYRSYCMHEYVVHDMALADSLFMEAYQMQKEDKLKGVACKLGLLKYFSQCESLDHFQLKEADRLLNEFVSRNMNFAFFKSLPKNLCSRYQLYNRILVECHARPDSRIQIHYRMPKQQEKFLTENMVNIYAGIFTWEFMLFLDDEVEYYITEETAYGMQQIGERRRQSGIEYRDVGHGGRYAFINQMLYLRRQGDYKELLQTMQEYEKLDILTGKLFKII